MAKWVLEPVEKKPVRVSDEAAAQIIELGGRYLGKYEAARMLAALELKQGATGNAKDHVHSGAAGRDNGG